MGSGEQAEKRYFALRSDATRYAWWLGRRSIWIRQGIDLAGWRLSRSIYKAVGKPSGALSWPVGLAFLVLNEPEAMAAIDCKWVVPLLRDAIEQPAAALKPDIAIDMAGLAYAGLRVSELCGVTESVYREFALRIAHIYGDRPGAIDGSIAYGFGRSEVLVDTLAFLCPFLARAGRWSGEAKFSDLAIRQIRFFLENAVDQQTGWVQHGLDRVTGQAFGMIGWGRGVGWLLLGTADTLLELDSASPAFVWLERGILELLEKLKATQRADGHWPWNLVDSDSPPDSSLAALTAYSVARLIGQHPTIFRSYSGMCELALHALNQATDQNGRIDRTSGEVGDAGTYNLTFGNYLWSQGPAVAAERIVQERLTTKFRSDVKFAISR